jgi:AraC family transcriptional regulator
MSESELASYQGWVGDFSEADPSAIVLSSQEQNWTGLEVVQIRHNANQAIAPALQSHLLLLHLAPSSNFVERIDSQIYEQQNTQTGDLSIIPAGIASEWYWDTQPQKSSLHLALDAGFVSRIASETSVRSGSVEILNQFVVHDPQLQYIGMALKAELESGGSSGQLFGESLATALALRLISQYSASIQPIQKYEGGLSRQSLRRVIEYINDNLSLDLKLHELAAIAGMGQSHFGRLFKQSTGVTPHQYVIQCRVERARQLLVQGGLTIGQVASAVGFTDQSHLTYHFKRLLGVTPRQYLQR